MVFVAYMEMPGQLVQLESPRGPQGTKMSDTDRLTARLFDDADKSAINPFELFEVWLADAAAHELNDPNAMILASVDESGLPDARAVLMNGRDERGPVFYTNLDSAKSRQLRAHPQAALLFHWKSVRRQIKFRGPVEEVSSQEADAYFATRPRGSQIGAHASRQSQPLADRAELEARIAQASQKFEGRDVPRPANWSGFRLVPEQIEFWSDGAFRLHDRVLFTRLKTGWSRQRLNP